MALVSMLVILVSVVTQGAMAPSHLRGTLKGNLLIRPGVFQAIGVISFGELHQALFLDLLLITYSFRMP